MLKRVFSILLLLTSLIIAFVIGSLWGGYYLDKIIQKGATITLDEQTKSPSLVDVPVAPLDKNFAYIKLASVPLAIELANTPELRRRGLSGRESLPLKQGKFFIFETSAIHSFWMKDMNFPLDIIWFNEDQEVVDITLNAQPEGANPTKLYKPKTEVKYVLEVLAGLVEQYNIVLGDQFNFCLNKECTEVVEIEANSRLAIDQDGVALRQPQQALPQPNLPSGNGEVEPAKLSDLPTKIKYDVPFVSQAPFGQWSDPRQQDACEEASILMAQRWLSGQKKIEKQTALDEIWAISKYQQEHYGYYQDTNAQDTAKLMAEYYQLKNISVRQELTGQAIRRALAQGSLVITPMNGQALNNPYYTPPGPPRHMILIIGYDDVAGEFVTNDPGTKRGAGYRYQYEAFLNAIRDYPSGFGVPMAEEKKAMIVIGPNS